MTYAYLRVSGESQAGEGKDGLRRQRAACEEEARKNGMSIDEYVEEAGVSGTKPWFERPFFREMRAKMKHGDNLVVENMDRIGRDTLQTLIILNDMEKLGVTIWLASGGQVVMDGHHKLINAVVAAAAEYNKYMLTQRMAAAKNAKLLAGQEAMRNANTPAEREAIREKYRLNGRKPFGARPGEREAIAFICDCQKRGLNLRQTAEALLEAGHKPRYGTEWALTTINVVRKRNL